MEYLLYLLIYCSISCFYKHYVRTKKYTLYFIYLSRIF